MKQELNIIKSYAIESINYGNKSGNVKALKKGQDVMYAVTKIEDFYNKVNNVLIHSKAQNIANEKLENELIDNYAKVLNPDRFKSSHAWRRAIDKFISE